MEPIMGVECRWSITEVEAVVSLDNPTKSEYIMLRLAIATHWIGIVPAPEIAEGVRVADVQAHQKGFSFESWDDVFSEVNLFAVYTWRTVWGAAAIPPTFSSAFLLNLGSYCYGENQDNCHK